MKQKKLLILGAMAMHVPIIKRAKERGIYVITCDYIPDNIGHKYADEAHFDSTTDFEAVLNLAKRCEVDGVMTFNSDPAALTAAYVAEKLGLPNSGFEAVRVMSEKDEFRKFLKDHEFNTPKFGNYSALHELLSEIDNFQFPIMLKPVDSSGSKGVVRIDNKADIAKYFDAAMEFSRCKRVIVEEFIECKGAQLHGDAFVKDGEIEFIYLGDHYFDKSINNLVPISTAFPSAHTKEDIQRVESEVARFIRAVKYISGGINIEARISSNNGKIYLIEIGSRNGGNFTPIVIQNASGFNFMDAWLDVVIQADPIPQQSNKCGYYSYLIIHSHESGVLDSVTISEELEPNILYEYIYLKKGDRVNSFKGANAAIGVLICEYNSFTQMNHIINNMQSYITVNLQ